MIASSEKLPLLSIEETKKLICEYQATKDKSIMEKLLRHNIRLVLTIARRCAHSTTIELDDLVQEGVMALMRCIETFDPNKGQFKHHAAIIIQNRLTLLHHNRHGIAGMHPSVMKSKIIKLQQHGFSREEVIKYLHLNDRLYDLIFAIDVDSLNRKKGREENEEYDEEIVSTLPAPGNLEDQVMYKIAADKVRAAVDKLEPNQRYVMHRRLCCYDNGVIPFPAIAKDLKLTKQRIAQIDQNAKKDLRSLLHNMGKEYDFIP